MKRLWIFVGLALGSCLCWTLESQAEISWGFKAGTLGTGPEVTVPFGEKLAFRGGFYLYDQDLDYIASGVDYQGSLQLRNLLAVVDFHPGGGAFRFSGGLAWNENSLEGVALIEDLLGLGEIPIPFFGFGTFRGEVTVNPVAPYLGFGWGKGSRSSVSGWGFSADFGVLFHGDPEVELTIVDSPFFDNLPGAGLFLDFLLEAERRELERELEDFRYFPVVALGVTYRF